MFRTLLVIAAASLTFVTSHARPQPPVKTVAVPEPTADSLPPGAKVTKLDVRPTVVKLAGPFAYSQLVVTATLESGETVDVTRQAKIDAPKAVTVSAAGQVRPVADATGDIAVSLGGQSARVPFDVSGAKADPPVSFVRDVQPVLSK